MPFKSKAQRRFFYSQLPQLAAKWEEHTPKGKLPEHARRKKKLEKKAFLDGFYSTLGQADELGALPTEDSGIAAQLILQIMRDSSLSPAQKNVLISRLEQRPSSPIATHRELQGAGMDPLQLAILNSYERRQQMASEASPAMRNILGLDTLNRIFSAYPLWGDMQVQDQRRRPEEEWESPWKVNQM